MKFNALSNNNDYTLRDAAIAKQCEAGEKRALLAQQMGGLGRVAGMTNADVAKMLLSDSTEEEAQVPAAA